MADGVEGGSVMNWIVTLDVTVEAISREEAFSKVEALLKDTKTYCLYDAEETDVGRGEWQRPAVEYEV